MVKASEERSFFGPTRWTLVMRARGPSAEAKAALSELCEFYYEPVFRFLLQERGEESARELAQEFFSRVLQRGAIGSPDPSRGRFRSYLLGALKHFLADRSDHDRRGKRGGGLMPESLDAPPAGSETGVLEVADPTATFQDSYFDRQWALTVMRRALTRLEEEWRGAGQQKSFEALKPFLEGGSVLPQAEVAAQLGMSEGALKVAIHRFRKRFRELIRFELGQTLEEFSDIDSELRYLVEVLSENPQR